MALLAATPERDARRARAHRPAGPVERAVLRRGRCPRARAPPRSSSLRVPEPPSPTGSAFLVPPSSLAGGGIARRRWSSRGSIAGIVALDPVERFEQFKNPRIEVERRRRRSPGAPPQRRRERPLAVLEGRGRRVAGRPAPRRRRRTYEAWWRGHGTLAFFVRGRALAVPRDARRARVVGFAARRRLRRRRSVGVRRRCAPKGRVRQLAAPSWRRSPRTPRLPAIDWMWELTVVSIVGMVAARPPDRHGDRRRRARASARGRAARRARRGRRDRLGLAVVAAQAVLLLARRPGRAEPGGVASGDRPRRSRRPAARPRAVGRVAALQLALVDEDAGRPAQARRGRSRRRSSATPRTGGSGSSRQDRVELGAAEAPRPGARAAPAASIPAPRLFAPAAGGRVVVGTCGDSLSSASARNARRSCMEKSVAATHRARPSELARRRGPPSSGVGVRSRKRRSARPAAPPHARRSPTSSRPVARQPPRVTAGASAARVWAIVFCRSGSCSRSSSGSTTATSVRSGT